MNVIRTKHYKRDFKNVTRGKSEETIMNLIVSIEEVVRLLNERDFETLRLEHNDHKLTGFPKNRNVRGLHVAGAFDDILSYELTNEDVKLLGLGSHQSLYDKQRRLRRDILT